MISNFVCSRGKERWKEHHVHACRLIGLSLGLHGMHRAEATEVDKVGTPDRPCVRECFQQLREKLRRAYAPPARDDE